MPTNMCWLLSIARLQSIKVAIGFILKQKTLLPLETLKPGINPGLIRAESPDTWDAMTVDLL